jgi:Chemotaxis response regulator containing a CheY-like receiver domain and a methylesterase domain
MIERDIVVVGASAGGVEGLRQLVQSIPERLRVSIFVTVHFPSYGTSMLPRILSRVANLPVLHPSDGEAIVPGRIYIAPPDFHLLLEPSRIRLVRGPRENGHRPAIDPMFRSAAVAFGPRVVGIVLTGNLDDGTSGLAAIKRHGGLSLAQSPEDALFPSMPQSAIEHVVVDRVAPIRNMWPALDALIRTPIAHGEYALMPSDVTENELAAGDLSAIEQPERHPGHVSAFSCPDCGGVLWELQDGDFVRFRCRVGHAWTSEGLVAKQSDTLDDALWAALRALEERVSLSRQLSERHRERGHVHLAARFERQMSQMQERADAIRSALMQDHGVQVTPDMADADDSRAAGD